MSSDEQDPLWSLIAKILDAENRGESVDRDALLSKHSARAESLRDFFAQHDRMKSAVDADDPTLPPNRGGPEEPTVPPYQGSQEEATIPPRAVGEDATLAPSQPASTARATVGDQLRYFGEYELLEEIARGGMGVVFRARQVNLNRIVALKMILTGQFAGEEDVQRFHTEAEAAAQLDHPGIVPIFEIGEHQGQHYFSMGYIEGESLAHRIANGPLPPCEAAELVKKICDAMAYAHERGVIHRDLKPANILIDQNGQPKVSDFGLAKRTEADSDLTGTGQILGTPAYMPPEQASGKTDVGPLADVYSLGAILYCLLTGRPPFQAASPMDTLLQVLDREPLAPCILNPNIPRDLETICLKCLSKEVGGRYATAADIGLELDRFQGGEPILARPVSPGERFWRWCKRNPVIAMMGFSIAFLTFAGFSAVTWQWRQAIHARELQADETRKVRAALYCNQITLAQQEIEQGRLAQANELLDNCEQELRNWEWDHLLGMCDTGMAFGSVYEEPADLAFTDDSKQLVVLGATEQIAWCDVDTRSQRQITTAPSFASGILSANGHRIVTKTQEGSIVVYQTSDVTRAMVSVPNQRYTGYAISHDGELLAIGGGSKIGLWSTSKGERTLDIEFSVGPVPPLAFSDDGRLLAASAGGKIGIWSTDTGSRYQVIEDTSRHAAIALSPDTRIVAAAVPFGTRTTVRLWDIETGHRLAVVSSEPGLHATDIAFSPDGNWLSVVGGTSAQVWDVNTKANLMAIPLAGRVGRMAVAFSPNSRLLAISEKLNVRIVRLPMREPLTAFREGPDTGVNLDKVAALEFNQNGESLLWSSGNGAEDRLIARIDAVTGQTMPLQNSVPLWPGVSVTADRARFVVQKPQSDSVAVYDRSSDEEIASFPGNLRQCAISSDGDLVASGEGVWEFSTSQMRFAVPMAHGSVVAFSPNSRIVAYGQQSIRLWDTDSGALIREINQPGRIAGLAFSPDGQRLVVSGSRGSEVSRSSGYVGIWDVESAQKVYMLANGMGHYPAVAFDNNGWRIAAAGIGASGSYELRIWNVHWPRVEDRRDLFGWHWREFQAHRDAERWPSCLFHLDRLINLEPENASIYRLRAKLYTTVKDMNEALSDYQEAVRLDQGSVEGWFSLANHLESMSRREDAIEAWTKVIELDPSEKHLRRRARINRAGVEFGDRRTHKSN